MRSEDKYVTTLFYDPPVYYSPNSPSPPYEYQDITRRETEKTVPIVEDPDDPWSQSRVMDKGNGVWCFCIDENCVNAQRYN